MCTSRLLQCSHSWKENLYFTHRRKTSTPWPRVGSITSWNDVTRLTSNLKDKTGGSIELILKLLAYCCLLLIQCILYVTFSFWPSFRLSLLGSLFLAFFSAFSFMLSLFGFLSLGFAATIEQHIVYLQILQRKDVLLDIQTLIHQKTNILEDRWQWAKQRRKSRSNHVNRRFADERNSDLRGDPGAVW